MSAKQSNQIVMQLDINERFQPMGGPKGLHQAPSPTNDPKKQSDSKMSFLQRQIDAHTKS